MGENRESHPGCCCKKVRDNCAKSRRSDVLETSRTNERVNDFCSVEKRSARVPVALVTLCLYLGLSLFGTEGYRSFRPRGHGWVTNEQRGEGRESNEMQQRNRDPGPQTTDRDGETCCYDLHLRRIYLFISTIFVFSS